MFSYHSKKSSALLESNLSACDECSRLKASLKRSLACLLTSWLLKIFLPPPLFRSSSFLWDQTTVEIPPPGFPDHLIAKWKLRAEDFPNSIYFFERNGRWANSDISALEELCINDPSSVIICYQRFRAKYYFQLDEREPVSILVTMQLDTHSNNLEIKTLCNLFSSVCAVLIPYYGSKMSRSSLPT